MDPSKMEKLKEKTAQLSKDWSRLELEGTTIRIINPTEGFQGFHYHTAGNGHPDPRHDCPHRDCVVRRIHEE